MKMAKKLLALVLTGVMAMSVLTGCGSTASRQAAGKLEGMLEGMLKEANPNATVEVGSEELANKAIEAATTDDGKFETNAKKNIKAALKEGNNDKYVWYAYFEAEGKNETDKAQAIANEILKTETDGSVTIGDTKAVNYLKVVKSYNLGDEFVLSMKEFTVTNDDKTTTDWIMAVVTCKGVENK
ncbi:MAG: hypothetical protein ACLTAA_08860 [Faecalibacterium prausnitzii]